MSVLAQGKDTTPGPVANMKALQPGKEYVFQYKAPGFAFSLLSDSQIISLMRGWINLKALLEGDKKGTILTVTGVKVDSVTGEIFMRAKISDETLEYNEAGVNPWAVAMVIGGIFAAIGIGVSLLFVYEVVSEAFGGGGNNPAIDPCTETGVISYVKCLSKKSAWIATGLVIGALLTLVLILLTLGRDRSA